MKNRSFIFGPVPSRRLGYSLGVDLVPFKTCSYDCIYCQLGRTTKKTINRKEYIPAKHVINELKNRLPTIQKPDYITLSGSGEPTLNSKIDEVIYGIKKITDIPVAVLTNGSTLWDLKVQEALMKADLIIPSLDAWDSYSFKYINRPIKKMTYEELVRGLLSFRGKYRGKFWLEVFLLGGVSTVENDLLRLKKQIQRIQPDKVQINTIDRPPSEPYAYPVSSRQMNRIVSILGNNVEVITDFKRTYKKKISKAKQKDVLTLIERRPCTISDVSEGLGIHKNEAIKYINHLTKEMLIRPVEKSAEVYYKKQGLIANDHNC